MSVREAPPPFSLTTNGRDSFIPSSFDLFNDLRLRGLSPTLCFFVVFSSLAFSTIPTLFSDELSDSVRRTSGVFFDRRFFAPPVRVIYSGPCNFSSLLHCSMLVNPRLLTAMTFPRLPPKPRLPRDGFPPRRSLEIRGIFFSRRFRIYLDFASFFFVSLGPSLRV